MRSVTVSIEKLKETLVVNREKHRETFEEAVETFRKKAIEVFEDNIRRVEAGEEVRQYLNLPVPADHTEDYDRAIQMLEWEVKDTTIELTNQEFAQFVQDDWGWKQDWIGTTASMAAINGPKYYNLKNSGTVQV